MHASISTDSRAYDFPTEWNSASVSTLPNIKYAVTPRSFSEWNKVYLVILFFIFKKVIPYIYKVSWRVPVVNVDIRRNNVGFVVNWRDTSHQNF